MSAINRLSTGDGDFGERLGSLLAFEATQDESIESAVTEILLAVRKRGDQALLEYTSRFDKLAVKSVHELLLQPEILRQAFDRLPHAQRNALETAASRIRAYHDRQRAESWSFTERDGTRLGQKITALDRVGVYVPVGKALMSTNNRPSGCKAPVCTTMTLRPVASSSSMWLADRPAPFTVTISSEEVGLG